jgi:protein-disulfide isomerase
VSKKTWIIFIVICVAVLGGLIILSRKDAVNVGSVDQSKLQAASTANGNIAEHVLGLPNGKVVLMEYGDYQCPYCGQAYSKVKSITTDYNSKITFIFRNFPLSSMHPNAKAAAAAAEAAGIQGKYWQMHDKLYETQSDWENASTENRTSQFVGYAKAIGIKDTDKFKADMASDAVNKKINFDLALGNKDKVSGTPAFFINGKQVSEEASSSVISGDGTAMRKALDELLK